NILIFRDPCNATDQSAQLRERDADILEQKRTLLLNRWNGRSPCHDERSTSFRVVGGHHLQRAIGLADFGHPGDLLARVDTRLVRLDDEKGPGVAPPTPPQF